MSFTIKTDFSFSKLAKSLPNIVKELKKDGTLVLEHQHDGRDIELSEANKVFEFINGLWGGEVKFTTIIEDDTWEF